MNADIVGMLVYIISNIIGLVFLLYFLWGAKKTRVTKRLYEIRNQYIQRGGKTLSPEELDEEIKSRR
jgi:hypothetical protein